MTRLGGLLIGVLLAAFGLAPASAPSADPQTEASRAASRAVPQAANPTLAEGATPVAGTGSSPSRNGASEAAIDAGSWSPGPDLPVNDLEAAVRLDDGRVLVTGGAAPDRSSASSYLYDPATSGWTTIVMLGPHVRAPLTRLVDGRVLVAGGVNGTGTVTGASAEVFDPRSGQWSATTPLPEPRSDHLAVLLADGRVLVIGGWTAQPTGGPTTSCLVYDPRTAIWSLTGRTSAAHVDAQAVLLGDGRVLLTGGEFGSASAETYDPKTGTWTRAADMGVPRSGHAVTLLGSGKVLVTGGDTWIPNVARVPVATTLASAELYDPETDRWTPTGDMSTPRLRQTATLLASGLILVVGGYPETTVRSAELYDPETGTWTPTAPPPVGHVGHTATLLRDGTVLVVDGSTDRSRPGAVDVYRPGATAPADPLVPRTGVTVSPPPDASGWRNKPTTIMLAAGASGGATITRLTYWATGAQPIDTRLVNEPAATIVISAYGATELHFGAVDSAGRTEPVRTLAIWIRPAGWRLERLGSVLAGATLNDVTYADGRYVAVGAAGGRAAAWRSKDGLSWSRVLVSTGKSQLRAVAAGHGRIVAIGTAGSRGAIWVSRDGRKWSRVALPALPKDSTFPSDVEVSASSFVAVGASDVNTNTPRALILVSPDGVHWSRAAHIDNASGAIVSGVLRGGPGLIAWGCLGDGYCEAGVVWTSRDGRVWRNRQVFPHEDMVSSVKQLFGAAGLWLALVEDFGATRLFTSTTGEHWTEKTETAGLCGNHAVRIPGAWLLVGYQGSCLSLDGVAWWSVPIDAFPDPMSSLAAGPGRQIAVGNGSIWVRP